MTDSQNTQLVLRQHYDILKSKFEKSDSLIIFFIPHVDDIVNGGIISIFSLAKESRRFKEIHGSQVIIATFPNKLSSLYLTKFPNDEVVYNFAVVPAHFNQLKNLIMHIPELMVPYFLDCFADEHKEYFKNIASVQINILNQNMNYMPAPEVVHSLKPYCTSLTITTAHISYTTKEYQQLYGVPYSRIGTYTEPESYDRTDYDHKKNVVMLSNDEHPLKWVIADKIRAELPHFEVISPANIPYDEYKKLMRDSKFMITFGEGMDNYFSEPVFSGSIAFAICEAQNEVFFSHSQRYLPTVYQGTQEALDRIIFDITRIDENKELYHKINRILFEELAASTGYEPYLKRLKRFYEKDYDFE